MEARKNKIRYGIGIALTIILTIDLLPYLWLLVSSSGHRTTRLPVPCCRAAIRLATM